MSPIHCKKYKQSNLDVSCDCDDCLREGIVLSISKRDKEEKEEMCCYPDCEQSVPKFGYLKFNGRKVCYTHFNLLTFLSDIL